MPRDGSGHSDNAIEQTNNVIHGSGPVSDSKVDRADKTAPAPSTEGGAALPGEDASGGRSQGLTEDPNRGQGGRGSTN